MLMQRVITALVLLVGVLAGLFFLPEPWVLVAFVLLLLAMSWEWAALTGLSTLFEKSAYALGVTGLTGLAALAVTSVTHRLGWQLGVLLAVAFALLAVLSFARKGRWQPGWRPVMRLFGVWWLGSFVLAMGAVYTQLGVWWLLYALSLVWLADSGAYFAGRRFGQRKLAVRVSPGKSWEGVLGGVALAVAFALAVAVWQEQSLLAFGVMALLVAGLSVAGDLFESALKRSAGVKDSGQMLPGHGGWLDRMDAQLLALPLFWVLWQWLVAAG